MFWMAERCNYSHPFFSSAYSPSSVSTIFQDSLLLSKASRTGSSYQNKGVEDVSWQESSPEGKGDPHLRNSLKLVLLLSTIQLLGTQVKPPKVAATSRGVMSTATETLPSPSSTSPQNMASEETALGFDDPDALSITFLTSLGNRSVQNLRHPWIQLHITTLKDKSHLGLGGKED